MALKKAERMDVPINPDDDPAVEAALGPRRDDVYDKIARARKMTDAQRRKAARDAARSKATFDLPEDMLAMLEKMAKHVYKCPPSHLVALLIGEGMKAIADGRLNVYEHRIPSRVPRYEFFLDLNDQGEKKTGGGWNVK
jgi:hypothetical protein